MSIEPHRSTTSVGERRDGGLVGDVDGEADPVREELGRGFGPVQVGHDDARALGREPVGDREPDALSCSRDDRDLAVEWPRHCSLLEVVRGMGIGTGTPIPYRSAENEVGVRMRFCWVWISGWILPMNAFQSSRAIRAARRSSRCAKLS